MTGETLRVCQSNDRKSENTTLHHFNSIFYLVNHLTIAYIGYWVLYTLLNTGYVNLLMHSTYFVTDILYQKCFLWEGLKQKNPDCDLRLHQLQFYIKHYNLIQH